MKDLSFDLETLSTRPDAAIVSIGATEFDRETGVIGRTFYAEVQLDSAIKHGHVCGDTLAWWMRQTDEARGAFSNDPKTRMTLPVALTLLREFVGRTATAWNDDVHVWGNGSSFDITILESAFKACPEVGPIPWKFWNIRDMRTLVDTAGRLGFDRKSLEFTGTAHNALHDSTHQAKVIAAAWQYLVKYAARGPAIGPKYGHAVPNVAA